LGDTPREWNLRPSQLSGKGSGGKAPLSGAGTQQEMLSKRRRVQEGIGP
jgi:hypothetical protein